MEKKEVANLREINPLKLAKDVAELKDALEASKLKELIIANVIQVQDKAVLAKVAKIVREILSPGRPIVNTEAPVAQGNG
jgi:hypothetical protein